MTASISEKLFAARFVGLVSIIPPAAPLSPGSSIPAKFIGKIPGRKNANGLWGGYSWRAHNATASDIAQWTKDGSSFGLRADAYPSVDVDCMDEELSILIQNEAFALLGPAPVRIGRAPKRLLMYRTDKPFGRMRMWIEQRKETHLVEILGQGQQFVVEGIHPTTHAPYAWNEDMGVKSPDDLTSITREMVDGFFVHLGEKLEKLKIGRIVREGDGMRAEDTAPDQQELRAPTLDLLRKVVRLIPNDAEHFPDRTSYIRMGYAIRAAGAADDEEAFAIFAEWADTWKGNARFDCNDPEIVRGDWRRMRGRKIVGWHWIAEQARPFGFDTAKREFPALEQELDTTPLSPPRISEQGLALTVAERHHEVLRYVPQRDCWIIWNGARWMPDAELRAEDKIKWELCAIADVVRRRGATDREKKESLIAATAICTAGKVASVSRLLKSNRSIAVSADLLDNDHWLLNTPSGIVDLRTGKLSPADPNALCTKTTNASPLFGGACPEWKRFLGEATGNNDDLISYLRRVCGYCLTGDTREQTLTFIFGTGGNGKGTFLNTLREILGGYAEVASMDTFTASFGNKHTTEVAMLAGARLVTASETEEGKRWDESKVKSLTGGDKVTARLMRQDNFTFTPQFKLVFVGNHAPEIRPVDAAMRRRIQIVGFDKTPAKVDDTLNKKLEREWPAILAWMIEGCLEWQRDKLSPPACVLASTETYFSGEDAMGRWLEACCEIDGRSAEPIQLLFQSWREWAISNGEFTGPLKRLSAALVARKFQRDKDGKTRHVIFVGLRLLRHDGFIAAA